MANEGGEWIMRGLDWDDPERIRNVAELISFIDEVGFLPLFANGVTGFSVEEHVSPLFWWTGDPEQDPWEWREIIARSGQTAYGKFFDRKAGFVSKKWFPTFANYRRDGYDFDSRWEDDLANYREKKIMDLFTENGEMFSYEIKRKAGFGKDGEKNFEGTITELQMQGYLVVRDFRRRKRLRDAVEYGWPISVYTTAEQLIGQDIISKGYKENPEESRKRIIEKIRNEFSTATNEEIKKLIDI